jgi:hypothetical protein
VPRRYWHVSPSLNRDSITEHGLDWTGMTITTGIASGPVPGRSFAPELDAVFLCESLDEVEFFVGFGQHALVDVWEVDGRDLAIVPAPDGWVMCRASIGPERLQLLHAGRTPEQRSLCTVVLGFRSTRLTIAEMTALAGLRPDDAGHEDGDELDDLEPVEPFWWWVIEGSDRYAPVEPQIDEVVMRIRAAEAGLTRLANEADEGEFTARSQDRGNAALSPETRALLNRVGVTITEN